MFEKGEYVVYGSRGVCRILDISHVDIPGASKDRLYYIMRPVHSKNGTVYLPTDSTKSPLRRIMTKEEADGLIREIPRIEKLTVPDEKKREESYKEALRTCNGRIWVSFIKALHVRRNERTAAGKKVTALDERYLRTVEQELYAELSIALGIPKDEMESYIYDHMEKVTG